VFALFSVFYLGEALKLTTIIGFAFIFVDAAFVFMNRRRPPIGRGRSRLIDGGSQG